MCLDALLTMKKILFLFALIAVFLNSFSQESSKPKKPYSNRFSILAGLNQPILLHGANVELNYFTNYMSFDYSHGWSLELPPPDAYKNQNLVLHLPYSTGFGVGYRITSYLDIRLEPKMHSFEVFYKDESQVSSNRVADYKTFTLGVGLYYRYFPFRNKESKFLQGITTSTSIRYWPNIATTLTDNKFSYYNKTTHQNETLKAANAGFANTPWVFNIAIGFTFGGK
jgi:hypothetical protein